MSTFSVSTWSFEATPRKLTAKWSIEDVRVLEHEHGIDLESEIAAALAQEIELELLASKHHSWSETKAALLEDLNPKKGIVDQLLGNAKDSLVAEHKVGSAKDFQKVMLPMIRRIIPGVIAEEIIGVQPMTEPQGLVYSLRYNYAEEKVEPNESLTDKLKGWSRAGQFSLHRPPVKVGKSFPAWTGRDEDRGHREV